MPALGGLVVEGGVEVEVVLGLAGGVRNAVEGDGVGLAAVGGEMADGEAEVSLGVGGVAVVAGEGGVVEGIGGDGVGGVEAGEGVEVVELVLGAGEQGFLAEEAVVASVYRVGESVGSGDVPRVLVNWTTPAEGVGAVEGGVGLAEDLNAGDADGGEVGEVDGAADVVEGGAVEEDLGGVRVCAADEEAGDGAGLAGLGDLNARDETERLLELGGVGVVGCLS